MSEPAAEGRDRTGRLLLALALWAHGLGLAGGFVYDDHRFVVLNPALDELTVTQALLDPATHTADQDRDVYRPLRTLGHAVDLARWGRRPFGFHLHSLVLHLLTVWLAWRVLAALLPGDGRAPAALGAAVLASHPLGVEVVDWISSRGDLYAALSGLAALGLARAWRPADGASRGRVTGHALLVALAAALATLGKESAAVLPAVAALHGWLLERPRRRLPAGVLPLAAGVLAALVLRQVALAGLSPVQTPPHGGSLWTQAGWAGQGLARLLGLALWPTGLTVDHPQDAWAAAGPVWGQGLTWLGWLLLATPALLAWRGRPVAAFLAGWALLAWLPSGSLVVTLRSLVTERSAYPMLVPLGALAGLALVGRPRRQLLVASAALGLVLAGLARDRVADFRDDGALWRAALEVHPRSVQAHLALALEEREPAAAGRQLERALAVAVPGSKLEAVALSRLGAHRLLAEGRPEQALPLLRRALAAWEHWARLERPGSELSDVRATLSLCLVGLRRYDEAEALLRGALADDGDPAGLLVRRALLAGLRWSQEGDEATLQAARQALAEAARVAPDHPLLTALAARLPR